MIVVPSDANPIHVVPRTTSYTGRPAPRLLVHRDTLIHGQTCNVHSSSLCAANVLARNVSVTN